MKSGLMALERLKGSAREGLGRTAAASKEKMEAAWAFIRYLSAPEQQKERALGGGYLPTREDCYRDEEILSSVPVITLGREAIRSVRSRPATPFYHDMSLVMAERFHASLTGAVSAVRSAETLQERLKDILEQAEAL